MGFCFSCCRRQKRRDDEREPLLARDPSVLPQPASPLEKVADVLGALNTGKLPSQDQLNHALRVFLQSDALGHTGGYGPLSQNGRKVVQDTRTLVEALLQVGLEKNDDDKVQDLVFQTQQVDSSSLDVDVSVEVEENVSKGVEEVVPNEQELFADVNSIFRSLRQLSFVLLTSSTFRLFFSDIMFTVREIFADAVANIGDVAVKVQAQAAAVESAVRPGVEPVHEDVDLSPSIEAATRERWETVCGDGVDRTKDRITKRVVELIQQSQKDPASTAALRTLFLLARKYAAKVSLAASAVSDVAPQVGESRAKVESAILVAPELSQALQDVQALLERAAGGHPLQPLLTVLQGAITAIPQSNALHAYLKDVEMWVERALKSPEYANTPGGYQTLQELYDRAKSLFSDSSESESNSQWSKSIALVFDEYDKYIDALSNDRSTQRLLSAINTLCTDLAVFGRQAVLPTNQIKRARLLKEELRNDAIAWLFPRLLRAFRSLPMPRFEMVNESMDLAVDSVVLTAPSSSYIPSLSASFLPDHVRIQNWSEVRLDVMELSASQGVEHPFGEHPSATIQSFTRVKVHVDGLRLSAHDIAYYVKYKPYIGYKDEGMLSVDIGTERGLGQGVSLDVELEIRTDDYVQDGDPEGAGVHTHDGLFRVTDVQVDVPGLQFSIDQSKHWILNKLLLQPLSGPIVRRVLRSMLATQLRNALENVSQASTEVHRDAIRLARPKNRSEEGTPSPSFMDYWSALLRHSSRGRQGQECSGEDDTRVETRTDVTMKGLVRTTVSHPDPDASHPPTPEESSIAVGVAAQLLPGKGGPHNGELDVQTPVEAAVEDIETNVEAAVEVVQNAQETAQGAVRKAAEIRQRLENAEERMERRKEVEVARGGWRSRVFDL